MKDYIFTLLYSKSAETHNKMLRGSKKTLRELSCGRIAPDHKKIANSMRSCHSFTDKDNS